MSKRDKIFFHVTSHALALEIMGGPGVDPKCSQGRQSVAWYVTRRAVPWAIAHCIQRHDCPLDQIAILTVKGAPELFLRTSRRFAFCTRAVLYPVQLDTADMWLQREERSIYIKGNNSRGGRWLGAGPRE